MSDLTTSTELEDEFEEVVGAAAGTLQQHPYSPLFQ